MNKSPDLRAAAKHHMPEIDIDKLLLIVVGVSLNAEVADRPLAYQLQARINDWTDEHSNNDVSNITPVICTDVWYLNNANLHRRPTISIGGPGVNSLGAYLQTRVPIVLQADERLAIQLDADMTDLRASIWGIDRANTAAAVELFERKYLHEYMRAVATQIEPGPGE